MITFEKRRDEDSGIDLFNITDHTTTILEDVATWSATEMMKLLDRCNVKYKVEDKNDS